jgi:hypothetical protein
MSLKINTSTNEIRLKNKINKRKNKGTQNPKRMSKNC